MKDRVRIYELAKELNISTSDLLAQLHKEGFDIKSHSSTIDRETAEIIIATLSPPHHSRVHLDLDDKYEVYEESFRGLQTKGKKKVSILKQEDTRPISLKKPLPKQEIQSAQKTVAVKEQEKPKEVSEPESKIIYLISPLTVRELAEKMNMKPVDLAKEMIRQGYMYNLNQVVDVPVAIKIANYFGYEIKEQTLEEEKGELEKDPPEKLKPRAPVVTVMGHVDHGKTKLLDAIRKTNIAARESGQITQHLGAYKAIIHNQPIVFLDTPGHEAFTAMRARGAHITDIVVLVVAADDGVMPQTIEAINHARSANVPIIVAINKIDLETANPERVKRQLMEHGLIPEAYGGQTIFVEISAKKGINIEQLLEMILLQAEIMELKANPDAPGSGTVIEAKLDKHRGPVATVLVQRGTVKVGDSFVAGIYAGKVRAMYDDNGKKLLTAPPSTPVEIIGITGVPKPGDKFQVMSEREARLVSQARMQQLKEKSFIPKASLSLELISKKIKEEGAKTLPIILKVDVQGSLEALLEAIGKISHPEVQIKLVHAAVGTIKESDVSLAMASHSIIIGFNTTIEPSAKEIASQEGVDIRIYKIIYDLIDDLNKACAGLLEPEKKEVVIGKAEVRKVFNIGKTLVVAGSIVLEGKVQRNARARVIRNDQVVYDGKLSSLKRFKEDAREVSAGMECGIGLENFKDFQEKDIIEVFAIEEVSPAIKK